MTLKHVEGSQQFLEESSFLWFIVVQFSKHFSVDFLVVSVVNILQVSVDFLVIEIRLSH